MSDTEIPGVEKHYATTAVAAMFDVTAETIRDWIKDGKMKARKINGLWRVPHSEVIRLGNQQYGDPEGEG